MVIGEVTLTEIGDAILNDLLDHKNDIDRAYTNCEDALSISISVKIMPAREANTVNFEEVLNVVLDRLKTKNKGSVSERQMGLFKKPKPAKVTPIRDRRGPVGRGPHNWFSQGGSMTWPTK